jgi:hypothetical protein
VWFDGTRCEVMWPCAMPGVAESSQASWHITPVLRHQTSEQPAELGNPLPLKVFFVLNPVIIVNENDWFQMS